MLAWIDFGRQRTSFMIVLMVAQVTGDACWVAAIRKLKFARLSTPFSPQPLWLEREVAAYLRGELTIIMVVCLVAKQLRLKVDLQSEDAC
eukprot:5027169-Amphidinium_carterae.1